MDGRFGWVLAGGRFVGWSYKEKLGELWACDIERVRGEGGNAVWVRVFRDASSLGWAGQNEYGDIRKRCSDPLAVGMVGFRREGLWGVSEVAPRL